MEINWYPGHMAKTKRLLQDQLRRVDLVIELCDARLPFSSRNPELGKMTASRPRLLLLNKADLADQQVTDQWLSCFRRAGLTAYPVKALNAPVKDILRVIGQTAEEAIRKAEARGMNKTVRAMVVGVPNVGKSTFINRIRGQKVATTGDRPGVTKSNQWVRITPYLELLDTPGMMWPRLNDQTAARRLCYIGSVKDDAVDIYMLTISMLEDLLAVRPDVVRERFHLEEGAERLKGEALLEAVCRGRGFLLKGGLPDYDRCCAVALDEFRAGKLGRISLERPGDFDKDSLFPESGDR